MMDSTLQQDSTTNDSFSREELLHAILEKKLFVSAELCFKQITDEAAAPQNETLCPRVWDTLMCWPPTPSGVLQAQPCPAFVAQFNPEGVATRFCTDNGTWFFNVHHNATWTNYSSCGYVDSTSNGTMIAYWLPVIKRISQIGYGVSLVTLLVALCILASFKKLYCPRNTLHMHLFISFIMRAFMALLKDNLFVDGVDLVFPKNSVDPHSYQSSWECKVVTSFWQYFIMANYSWIFMEGLYLHNLIFMALFTDSSAITIYILLGWGLPLLFVLLWIVMRALFEDIICWTTNKNEYIFWLIRGPITVSILVNFIFFLHIVWVLLSKLRSSVSAETRRYRYRKWAKSTLVLVPLFGVHYTVFVGMQGAIGFHEAVEIVWLFGDQLFACIQGFLVAVLYCLLNGEVRGELSRRWKRWRQNHRIDSPWLQHSITNNSRTNTTRWRTSFHSLPAATSIGRDMRVRSLTPPLVACYSSNPVISCSISDSRTVTTRTVSKSSNCGNRLEKINSENEDFDCSLELHTIVDNFGTEVTKGASPTTAPQDNAEADDDKSVA